LAGAGFLLVVRFFVEFVLLATCRFELVFLLADFRCVVLLVVFGAPVFVGSGAVWV
jgi:hypothetical protein